ncbi:KAP family P-loop NTPase fold protein [Methanosphaerula subterraneus]|uniref:KAP family P-loop NTPase fold protein n=1 Tax=Methanosphaerula subterraneus TaxID=3350244 RepID=UPI003F854F76
MCPLPSTFTSASSSEQASELEGSIPVLTPDRPLNNPADDLFGSAPYAKVLARGILGMFNPDGFVVALHGPWGSGKTTLLNFTRCYLEDPDQSEHDPITIIDFNPWWFSGREDLTRQFFANFSNGLSDQGKTALSLAKALGELGNAFSPVRFPIGTVIDELRGWLDQDKKNIRTLKNTIADEIIKLGRVLIIIDDIDRLTPSETREIFQVIKAIGDFPNVVYLLAYDPKIILASIKEPLQYSAEDYLDKIIQCSFDLPSPTPRDYLLLFEGNLKEILVPSDYQLLGQDRGKNILSYIISMNSSPRKIKRLINSMRLSYPAVMGEVNPVDFVAIETIRIRFPVIHSIIQRNGSLFYSVNSYSRTGKNARIILDRALQDAISDKDDDTYRLVKNLIEELFPAINSSQNEPDGNPVPNDYDLLRDRRICTPQNFPTYFRWSIPINTLSNRDFDTIIALEEIDEIEEKLIEFSSNIEVLITFLNLFLAHNKEISIKAAKLFFSALLNVGDDLFVQITGDRKYPSLKIGSNYIPVILFILLNRIKEDACLEIILGSMENSRSLLMISILTHDLGTQHGKYGVGAPMDEKDRTLSTDDYLKLEQTVSRKIQSAALDDRTLLDTPSLNVVLDVWRTTSPSDGEMRRSWADKIINSSETCIQFLEGMHQREILNLGHQTNGPIEYLTFDFHVLQDYVEMPRLISIVNNLLSGTTLRATEKRTLIAFIRYAEKAGF